MDLSKLSDVVGKEAKAEADQIIQTARIQSETLLDREKQLIEHKSKERIEEESMVYLGSVLSKSPVQKATVFVSPDLENIIHAEVLKAYNTASGSAFAWGGVDAGLQLGLAIEHGLVRYIFPLSESIQHFIQEHANELNDKFYS
jgi:hypothetical protein